MVVLIKKMDTRGIFTIIGDMKRGKIVGRGVFHVFLCGAVRNQITKKNTRVGQMVITESEIEYVRFFKKERRKIC